MSAAVIIVAAGQGKRFSSDIPKQFVKLNGIPVFLWSVFAYKKSKIFSQIIVVVPKNFLLQLGPYANKYDIELIAGGKERFDSVKSGLRKLKKNIDYVAIHDGARPLIKIKEIIECLNAAKKCGAAIVAVPAKDTVKKVSASSYIEKTIPRNSVWLAQTPQIFKKSLIQKAYAKKISPKTTDDAQLVEIAGGILKIVNGDYNNLKITEPRDLQIAELLLKSE